MPNTVIALKKSATPSSVPSNLANGELAINYADGKLYYKAANGTIASISGNEPNYFGSVNANNTLVVADTPGDVFTLATGNNIVITGDAINDKITVGLTNDVNLPGTLTLGTVGGDEGGELRLANAITNSVLTGEVVVDVYQNKLRFFESGGTNRGAFINLASASTGVGTDLLASSSGTDTAARTTANAAFLHANAAFITANIAFANANTVMISAQAAFTVANSGFLHANASFAFGNSAHSIANLAFTHANAAFTNANTVMVSAQAAFTVANSSFLHANSGYAFANSIAITANLAFAHANAAFANGNTVIQTAQSAFNQANISFLHANAAFASANAGQASGNAAQATANASYAFGNSAHSIANLAFTHANAAFASSNSVNTYSNSTYVKLVAASQTITGNLAITGSLTVSGNAYTIDSQTLRVSDPLIYLAGNNYVSDIVDIGFVANYVNATGSNVHTGLFRDATIKEYYLFEGYDKEPEPNHIDTAGNNFTISVLNATLKTSNLILGGANAILTIGASFNHANAAHSSANAGMAIGNGAFASANAGQATANAAFNRANTANITADRAWNHANAAFITANAALPASSYTASDVLSKLLTVDGAGSGLDADLLDGISSGSFLRSDISQQLGKAYVTHDFNSYPNLYDVTFVNPSGSSNLPTGMSSVMSYRFIMGAGDTTSRGFDLVGAAESNGNLFFRERSIGIWNEVWHNNNDGAGSGLDADLLDGQQGTYYGIATDVTAANRVANAAFLHANASYAFSNSAHSIANLAFTHANGAFAKANAALANTAGISTAGALIVPGILTANAGQNGFQMRAGGTADHVYIEYYPRSATGSRGAYVGYASAGTNTFSFINETTTGSLELGTAGGADLAIDSAGNVGIGRTNPGFKLDVVGTANASNILVNGNMVFTAANDGSGSNLDADLLDGQQGTYYGIATDVSAANRVANAAFLHANASYAFSNSAHSIANLAFTHANAAFAKANASLANTTRTNWAGSGIISGVVGQLAWKNYSNNHTIFDASASTSPDGGAVNNTNPDVSWTATYPTLMGWNGVNTYGVRVDSAKSADSATTASQIDGVAFYNGNSTNGVSGPDNLTDNGIAYVTSLSLYGQVDGAVYSQAYNSNWVHQIYGDYRTGQIALRGKNNGTWQSWRNVLDSTNFTTYAPSVADASASFLRANLAHAHANASYAFSNSAHSIANLAFTHANNAYIAANTARTVVNDTVNATRYLMFANGTSGTSSLNVAVGLAFTPSSNTLNINGALNAVTKSFVIPHPVNEGMFLRYGSLEGPENGVYIRGKIEGKSIIELPEYWWNLIDQDTITVNLTPYGRSQDIWVQSTSAHFIHLNQPADCFFTVFAERKDVDKLVVEY